MPESPLSSLSIGAPQIATAPRPDEPLVILLASLALGGAERIVVDWIAATAPARAIELVILHDQPREYAVHPAVSVVRLHGERLPAQLGALVERLALRGVRRVVTHLVRDESLAFLWGAGLETIPVIHNTRAGWRNDPRELQAGRVPFLIAVADAVAAEVRAAGFTRSIITIRHQVRPALHAVDAHARCAMRARWGCATGTLVIGMIGAFKAQKAYPRAIRVLREVLRRRDARLVIAGDALGAEGRAAAAAAHAQAERLGLAGHVIRLGAVHPIAAVLPAFDVVLNTSTHEGLSVATLEALAAGLPVVATRVGGQGEIDDPRLHLVGDPFEPAEVARTVLEATRSEVRRVPAPLIATHPLWTLVHRVPGAAGSARKILFVTANLNAGGAQRSLVNLGRALRERREIAIAVVDASTHRYFTDQLAERAIEMFRPAPTADPFAAAEGLLAWIATERPRVVCFWSVDPKLKLLLAKMLAPSVCRLVDVSPGRYSFLEMTDTVAFQRAIAFDQAAYERRLDALVLKYHAADRAPGVEVIPNGVAPPACVKRDYTLGAPARVLVSGRIAPSKRLERILGAIERLRRPALELHVYGEAEPRHRNYLAMLLDDWLPRLGARLVLHGARPGALDTLAEFDAIAVLGEHQGSPNTVLEALAAGLPVLANASGGTGELVRHGVTGTLVSENAEVAEIAAALATLLDDREHAARLALAGRRLVAARFGIDRMADRYGALFDRLEGDA